MKGGIGKEIRQRNALFPRGKHETGKMAVKTVTCPRLFYQLNMLCGGLAQQPGELSQCSTIRDPFPLHGIEGLHEPLAGLVYHPQTLGSPR